MGKAATRATTARKKTSSSAAAVAVANTATITTTAASSSSAAAEVVRRMKRKKKKGRPSLADLQKREKKTLASVSNSNSTPTRRSTRRNPSNYNSEIVNDDYDDDDDERKEKKVKLVVRLPQSNQPHLQNSSSQNSGSGSDSEPEEPYDQESVLKKRKINAVDRRSSDVDIDQGEKGSKAMDTLQGSLLESGPTTPLPDKKLLVFILDRLQKKDTYGVFSEPVDPNELPDYHEIIEHPMDFGTVRKKLDVGSYLILEELEADIFLICSNAMQYNAPDTVYFRQARSIQELAKRDFENLRHEGDDGEPQPKVVRRGRPPSKNVKRPVENSPTDRVALELSPVATLASGEDRGNGSNAYNLRKGAAFPKFRSNDGFATPFRPRNGENYSEWLVDWNSEFPASILRADMKYGKKHFSMIDENKRDTYKQFHPPASGSGSYLSNASGDMMMKRLIPVGMHFEPHGYARSLARYAANLGPVVWKIASQKLRSALPDGMAFGPGWVGESEAPAHSLFSFAEKQRSINGISGDHELSRLVTPSSSGVNSVMMSRPSEEMIEAVRRLNSQSKIAEQGGGSARNVSGSPFLAQQKPVFHPNRNGFNAMFGYEVSSQMGISRLATSSGQPPALLSTNDTSSVPSSHAANSEEMRSVQNWGASHPHPNSNVEPEVGGGTNKPSSYMAQQRQPLAIPPDLNVRVQTSSSPSSSSLQIGSPQQPDLALQL